jgi:DNA-binding response OmpR family regulator
MKTAKKKILLVDDEPHIVKLVQARLKGCGYDVLTASDGQAGLERAKTEMPDLLILDLMLPKMDGYAVCERLKSDPATARIPIIMFTARAQEGDIKRGKEAGADAYITKPFDAAVLLKKIEELMCCKES